MAIVNIDWNPAKRTLRNFGLIAVVAFALFGALIYWRVGPGKVVPAGGAGPTAYVLWVLAVYSALCAAAAPKAVKPLYLLLSVVGYPIGIVVSHVVMAIVYYLVITPVGIVFKIIGRDAMHRKFEPSAETYWIERRLPDTVKRYFRQF